MNIENQYRPIMVSVWCRTYNHVNYIKDALDGLVSQQTDFAYKVIVFDDASTDGTSDIVRSYAEKYPEIIYAIIAEENIYHHPDTKKIIADIWKQHLTGKYMAFCEGDDFWIDNNKLQIQVDYMEAHPECSMYMHNAMWLNCQNGAMRAENPFSGNGEWDVAAEELIMQYSSYPATASFLFKSEQINKPEFFTELSGSDYSTILYALATGKVHYSSRIMSVYRVFSSGSYGMRMQQDVNLRVYFYLSMLIFLRKYDQYTDYRYHEWCSKRVTLCEYAVMYGSDQDTLIADQVKCGREKGYVYPADSFEYADQLDGLRKQKLPDQLENFIHKYRHVIIMGTGEFGAYTARQLLNHQVEFGGFVVTTKSEDFFMEKPVYNLSELPYDRKDTGVVVGICPFSGRWRWESILESLEASGIENYYCPFL